MIENDAKHWIAQRYTSEKLEILEHYVALLIEANAAQNLISKASERVIWTRHILDSAQLLTFAPQAANWLDVGSGPGLPGIVLAILSNKPVRLVEPRRRRVEFIREAVELLKLATIQVEQAPIERLSSGVFAAVTARAFAPLPQIFSSTIRFTDSSTVWVLPKGKSAEQELVEAERSWQGVFHVEHSVSDDDARIIVASGVQPR